MRGTRLSHKARKLLVRHMLDTGRTPTFNPVNGNRLTGRQIASVRSQVAQAENLRAGRSLGPLAENPLTAPGDALGGFLWGGALVVGSVAVGAAVGGVVGYATTSSAAVAGQAPFDAALGALTGGALGIVGAGIVGLGVAVFSPEWRPVGLWTAGIVAVWIAVGAVVQAASPQTPTPTPSTSTPSQATAPTS